MLESISAVQKEWVEIIANRLPQRRIDVAEAVLRTQHRAIFR